MVKSSTLPVIVGRCLSSSLVLTRSFQVGQFGSSCNDLFAKLLVIPTSAYSIGLDIGVAQLSKNERAIMTIPAHLAYGDKGFPGLIPGKSELIFDIELIEISTT